MKDSDNKTKEQLLTELKDLKTELAKSPKKEQKLKDDAEKFKDLHKNAPLSYHSLDENGSFININPLWLKTPGYKKEEVFGKSFADFMPPDWKPHFEKNFPAFKKRGYVHDVQSQTMPHSKQTPENQTKRVATGHLATGSQNGTISTSPLGSCVAVIAYDKTSKTGGIAHIMLPGKSPTEDKAEENKYAENAIENLLDELNKLGGNNANVEICLVGGANVLKKENDTTSDNLIFSIFEIIERKKLSIKKTSTGGYERRTAKLCLHSGIVTCALGDKSEAELFNFISGNTGGMSHEKR